jgi:hypothetical protein
MAGIERAGHGPHKPVSAAWDVPVEDRWIQPVIATGCDPKLRPTDKHLGDDQVADNWSTVGYRA